MRSTLILLAAVLLLGCSGPKSEIKSFDDCVKAGYPVFESFPRQCKTPDGKTFISDEDQAKNIRTFEDCEAAGFPIMESYPRQCRTLDGRTFVSNVDRYNIEKEISCGSDSDCQLANSARGLSCCYAGACDPADYSLEQWEAVNAAWYHSARSKYCPTPEQCGPAPMCLPKPLNDNYSAKCIAKECRKVPIRCTSDKDCGAGASCWFKLPAGPSAGKRGSPANPGSCWDDEAVSAIVSPFSEACCAECARAFSMSPVGAGPEGVKCGAFSSAYEMSAFCEQYFASNPTIVAQCLESPSITEDVSFTPGSCNALDQNGPMAGKLNIIFIPSHHYSDMSGFAADVPAFRNALLDFPFYDDNDDKINFFFLAATNASDGCALAGNTTPYCDIPAMKTIASACNYSQERGDQIVVLFDNRNVDTPYARGEGPDDILFIGSESSSIFVHEFSHSFGDLADTYDGAWNNTVDPAAPNCASATPGFTCADKWGDLIGTGSGGQTVGCFQNCHAENWYRPTLGGDVMRNLGYDFYDPVSLRHMQSLMSRYT